MKYRISTNLPCIVGRVHNEYRSLDILYSVLREETLHFKSHFDLSEGTGTIFSSITKDELFGLRVIYDKKVSKFFNEKTQYIDDEIILISKQNQKLTQLQSLLLSRLAVGEEVGV